MIYLLGMGNKRIESFLSRKLWREDGIYYFCRLCGDYKHEDEFYNSVHTPFGKTYKCKIHFVKDKSDNDPEMEHLKMNSITDSDFQQTEVVLKNLGYKFGPNELPVWKQFEIKHNL